MPSAAMLRRSPSPAQPSLSGRFSAMSVDHASYACRAPSGLSDSDSDSGAEASFSVIAPHACALLLLHLLKPPCSSLVRVLLGLVDWSVWPGHDCTWTPKHGWCQRAVVGQPF